MFWTVRDALVHDTWRAIPMTLGAVCLTSVFQIVQNTAWGFQPVQNLGSVKAADPFWLALLRTPLSLFVPALDLPVWGALAQILLVFGIAEICIGWWRTLLVGYVATLAGTTYARIGLALGPEHPWACRCRTGSSTTPGPRRRWWGWPSTSAGATGRTSPAPW